MILTLFTVVTLLSNFSVAYAAYGLWYTTGSVQCNMPDGSNAMARVKVYLLKKQTFLLPFGYFELICSWNNTATQTVITTTKPTNWKIEWTFLNDDGYVACRAYDDGSGFPAKVPTPGCDPYEATVSINAPTH